MHAFCSWCSVGVRNRKAAAKCRKKRKDAIDNYEQLNQSHVARYGEKCWTLIYQHDVRWRREKVYHLRDHGAEKLEDRQRQGLGYSDFDPAKPWSYCL